MCAASFKSLCTSHSLSSHTLCGHRYFSSSILSTSFEPSAEARARAAAEGNAQAEDLIPLYRQRAAEAPGRGSQTYYVVNSADALAKLGPDAWDRVVCVMTTGQAWQFRPYKWTEPRSLFHHGACLPSFARSAMGCRRACFVVVCSERRVCLLDERSPKREDQGLERNGAQGAVTSF